MQLTAVMDWSLSNNCTCDSFWWSDYVPRRPQAKNGRNGNAEHACAAGMTTTCAGVGGGTGGTLARGEVGTERVERAIAKEREKEREDENESTGTKWRSSSGSWAYSARKLVGFRGMSRSRVTVFLWILRVLVHRTAIVLLIDEIYRLEGWTARSFGDSVTRTREYDAGECARVCRRILSFYVGLAYLLEKFLLFSDSLNCGESRDAKIVGVASGVGLE